VAADQAGNVWRPLRLYGVSLVIFLASLADPTSASSANGNPCPPGYQGFILTGLCSGVAWCNNGTVEFEATCGEDRIFDAKNLTCRSENEYDCPTQPPTPVTDNPSISHPPSPVTHTISQSDVRSTVKTKQPTVHPTAPASSDEPSSVPSANPVAEASDVPTSVPSANPTPQSSDAPSSLPSANPTPEASDVPTSVPSANPTLQTSSSPSSLPSANPVPQSSDTPSTLPSANPVAEASDVPTSVPSADPTPQASDEPSSLPSANPIAEASDVPTSVPSADPTPQSSDAPSSLPSANPVAAASDAPSSSPTGNPTALASDSPSSSPTANPVPAPSDVPTLVPSSATPTVAPDLIISNKKITPAPVYAPVTIGVASAKYEIAITGLSTFLFHTAFAELNNILDGMVVSNLKLSTGILDVKLSTSLMSQGVQRRFSSDAALAVSPLTNMRFQPISSTIVTRPQSNHDYKVNLSDDFLVLRRRLQSSVADEDEAAPEDDASEGRELGQSPPPMLFAIMQKQMYITVPATGPNGEHDTELIPSTNELNGSISTVFRDETQKALFVSWLRAGDVDDFNDVQQADFVGFVNEYWTMPKKSQANVVMSSARLRTTSDFPGGNPPLL